MRAIPPARDVAFASVSLFSLVHDDEEASHASEVPFAAEVASMRVSRIRNLWLGSHGWHPPTADALTAGRASAHAILSRLVALLRRTSSSPLLGHGEVCAGSRSATGRSCSIWSMSTQPSGVRSPTKRTARAGGSTGVSPTLGAFEATAAGRARITSS
jgi:hypothetical protein